MFLHRLFSTVILLGLLSSIIFVPMPWRTGIFYGTCVLMTALLIREITNAIKNLGINTNEKMLPHIGALCMIFIGMQLVYDPNLICGFLLFCIALLLLAVVGTVAVILKILFAVNDPEKIKKILYSVLVLVCVLVPVTMIQTIYAIGDARCGRFNLYFLFFILMTKIGDIGAYVVGTLSNKIMKGGNHKMIPSISPGKSWEGMAGGLIITVLFGLLLVKLFGWTYPKWIVVIMGIVFYFAGMAGDLAESSFKRAVKIKDSGHLIPGIGGIFDLVDSPFLTSAFFLPVLIVVQLFNS